MPLRYETSPLSNGSATWFNIIWLHCLITLWSHYWTRHVVWSYDWWSENPVPEPCTGWPLLVTKNWQVFQSSSFQRTARVAVATCGGVGSYGGCPWSVVGNCHLHRDFLICIQWHDLRGLVSHIMSLNVVLSMSFPIDWPQTEQMKDNTFSFQALEKNVWKIYFHCMKS